MTESIFKLLILFSLVSLLFVSCFDNEAKEIHLEGNMYLSHSEGDSVSNYYSLAQKFEEHSFKIVIDNKVVYAVCDSSNLYLKTINWKHDTTYYFIKIKKDSIKSLLISRLSKNIFLEKVNTCISCKKIIIE